MGACCSKPPRQVEAATYFRKYARTGDVALFEGHGTFSEVIRMGTFSRMSHCAMVVRTLELLSGKHGDIGVYLWHSPSGPLRAKDLLYDPPKSKHGPQLNNLPQLVRNLNEKDHIFIRRVKFIDTTHEWAQNDGRISLDGRLASYMRKMHTRGYEKHTLELILSAYDGPFGKNTENMSSVFCSELIAHTMKKGAKPSLLPTSEPCNEFTPADFEPGEAIDYELDHTIVQYGGLIELV